MAGVAYGDYIYLSEDYGETWEQQTAAGYRSWSSVGMSSDGKKIIAGVYDGGNIYLAHVEGPATTTFNLTTLTGASQTATTEAVKNSALSVTSETCYTLYQPSIRTLSADGLTVPDGNVSLLGGIGFNVNCATAGGNADVAVALGSHYTNPSDLRIYKQLGTGPLVDITSQVTITNQDISGTTKTTLSYNLVDGGALDEDGIANGAIVDPIYIGAVMGASSTTGGVSASTGSNLWAIATVGMLAVLLSMLSIIKRPKHLRTN